MTAEGTAKNLYFQWHITDACNFRCRHCYQEDFSKASELPFSGLMKIYENIASSAGGRKVVYNLTGGEPFLHDGFFELLRFLDDRPETEEVMVITNASLIDEAAVSKLKQAKKLKKIKVSLDGATEKTNDSIRRQGAYRTALEKINLLQESGRFEIIVMLTAMRSNAYEVPALYQLCRELKVDGLMIERFIPLGQSRGLKAEMIDSQQWRMIVRDICEYMEVDFSEREILPCKAFWIRFKEDDAELLGAECNLGDDAFAIMPNGDLYPCRRFALKIGNISEKSLTDIVRSSDLLKEITDKSKMKGKCRTCGIDNCRGCRALAYALGRDYLAEDEHCWK